MNRDLFIGFVVSVLLHVGFAFSGDFFKGKPAPAPVDETIPVIELAPLPPVEPDPVEMSESSGEPSGDLSDLVPPMQTDTPAPTASMFAQPIQPLPLPGFTPPAGTIIIPSRPGPGNGPGQGLGDGLKNLFDLASLDQPPVARGPIRPLYPHEMSRTGTNGEVVVGFIVDSEGNVQAPYIVSSTHRAFEAEALRAVSRAKFKPGRKNGANVNTRNVRLSIVFNISGN